MWPSITPDVGAFLRKGSRYLSGSPGHPGQYGKIAIWGLGLLTAATLLAYLATKPSIRRRFEWFTGPYPHDSTVSAWWILFDRWPENRNIELACLLDDGSAVRGRFGSFNPLAEDSPDRELILQEPIHYRPPGDKSREVLYDVSAVSCSARRIVALFVTYSEPQQEKNVTPVQELKSPLTAVESGAGTTLEASTQEAAQSLRQQQASDPSQRQQVLP